jgi:hypothetical protein
VPGFARHILVENIRVTVASLRSKSNLLGTEGSVSLPQKPKCSVFATHDVPITVRLAAGTWHWLVASSQASQTLPYSNWKFGVEVHAAHDKGKIRRVSLKRCWIKDKAPLRRWLTPESSAVTLVWLRRVVISHVRFRRLGGRGAYLSFFRPD